MAPVVDLLAEVRRHTRFDRADAVLDRHDASLSRPDAIPVRSVPGGDVSGGGGRRAALFPASTGGRGHEEVVGGAGATGQWRYQYMTAVPPEAVDQ